MIKTKNIYEIVAALVPLYVTLILAYCSIRWWKIFTPEQCSGINRFVAVFAIPFLSFHFISSNNFYTMNFRFLAADSLQKVVILVALFLWNTFTKWGSIDWTITLFSLSTLPNTLIMGIPLLKAMYGDFTQSLMVQIVVLQCVIWYTLLLFLFEYRGAKLLISEQFPDTAGAIASVRVDSNVSSLCGTESLQADAEIGENGALHVVVRSMSRSMSIASSLLNSHSTSRPSNLNNVPSREPRQKASSFSGINLYPSSLRSSGFEEVGFNMHEERIWRSKSVSDGLVSSNISVKSMLPRPNSGDQRNKDTNGGNATNKDLSSSSNVNVGYTVNRIGSSDHGTIGSSKTLDFLQGTAASKVLHELEIEEGVKHPELRSRKEVRNEEDYAYKKQQMPRASVMIRLILIMVWRNLIRNPNSYASVLGIVWSLISFRWNINMPSIVKDSISILSNTGLGMAMFSLGLFTALQPKIITCGKIRATISMAIKFLVGPVVIAATSKAMNIHGVFLKIAIVQAALPQGIVPFVFAKEYNLHADILSTAVIFGMLVALPVTIIYYMLLGL